MIRRIELVNFMSHTRTVIEPADGLTVLVGSNNCGKSAIVAALQILCHNDNSTYVTRHNERECSVTVETDDGHVVEWRRKNNSPRYTVDGQLFDRLGRGAVPDGLHDVLRLPKIIAEGNQEFDVHFGEQKSPVFLLDKPGSHAAQFFASSSDAASLVEMQKRHQQKIVEARRERAQLEARAERLTADLAILAPTDQIGLSVGEVEVQHDELGRLAAVIGELTYDAQALMQAILLLDHHQSEAATVAVLAAPPVLESPESLARVVEELISTRMNLQKQSSRAVSLSSLPACPDCANDQPLTTMILDLQSAEVGMLRLDGNCFVTHDLCSPPAMIEIRDLQKASEQIGAIKAEVAVEEERFKILESLVVAPKLETEDFLTQNLQALVHAASMVKRRDEVHDYLRVLAAPPSLVVTSELQAMIREMTGAEAIQASQAAQFEQAEQALKEIERLLRNWAEEKKLCPICGGQLDPNQLVTHSGSVPGGHSYA